MKGDDGKLKNLCRNSGKREGWLGMEKGNDLGENMENMSTYANFAGTYFCWMSFYMAHTRGATYACFAGTFLSVPKLPAS